VLPLPGISSKPTHFVKEILDCIRKKAFTDETCWCLISIVTAASG